MRLRFIVLAAFLSGRAAYATYNQTIFDHCHQHHQSLRRQATEQDRGEEDGNSVEECLQRFPCEWTLWGEQLSGAHDNEMYGTSVSLSRSGYILAIGAQLYNQRGRVQVHHFVRDGRGWQPRGQDIMGDGPDGQSYFGTSVDLSSDGNRLVVGDFGQRGLVKVFDYRRDGDNWVQLGSTLRGPLDYESEFGRSVRISGDGRRIVVGDPIGGRREKGRVKIYELIDGDWQQVGQGLSGRTAEDHFGTSVDINDDGSIVVVGGPENERNGVGAGHVRAYQFRTGRWRPVGQDMHGVQRGESFGNSVAVSADGMSIIAGAVENLGQPENGRLDEGYIQFWDFDSDDGRWFPVGDIVRPPDGRQHARFGNSVDISEDSSRVVTAANDVAGRYAGVFQVAESGLILIGDYIRFSGRAPFGYSAAISGSGDVVAIGGTVTLEEIPRSRYHDAGYVRVYRCIPES